MNAPKRKQNYIDASVQGGLIRRILVHWVMFLVVTAVTILSLKTLLGDPSQSFNVRFQQQLSELVLLVIIFIAIFPAFMLDTIRFSNRFVGPITRLRKHLRELGENGQTTDIKFRDNDFWQEIADEFNAVNKTGSRVVKRQPMKTPNSQIPTKMHRLRRHENYSHNKRRKGAATVELAVCLPMLVILVFGSLSATSMIFMRQADCSSLRTKR